MSIILSVFCIAKYLYLSRILIDTIVNANVIEK